MEGLAPRGRRYGALYQLFPNACVFHELNGIHLFYFLSYSLLLILLQCNFFLSFLTGGLTHPITLEDVLIFATGLRRIPAMGFVTQPELAFLHPEDGLARFPKANTCSLVLQLPVGQAYTEFKNNMELGIGAGEWRTLR